MAWTQADIDRLQRLIATGTRRTEFVSGDTSRKQELHSLQDMLDLLAKMKTDLAGPLAPARTAVTQFDRD